jgi:hypothetical protein
MDPLDTCNSGDRRLRRGWGSVMVEPPPCRAREIFRHRMCCVRARGEEADGPSRSHAEFVAP